MMVPEIWLAFMTGLAGSGHCLGMCGGIVTALALANPAASASRRLAFDLAYHAGRICTYVLMGLLVGSISQTALLTSLKPYLLWLFAAANCLVILIGLGTIFGIRSMSLSSLDGAGWGFMGRALKRAAGNASPEAALGAGLVMGLIPCGMVYGVLLATATTGSLVTGGAMMLAFGLGTLPALLVYGQLASSLSARFNIVFLRLMGLAVVLLGANGLWKVLMKMGHGGMQH